MKEPSEGLDEYWSHWNSEAARSTAARSKTGLNCWRNRRCCKIWCRSLRVLYNQAGGLARWMTGHCCNLRTKCSSMLPGRSCKKSREQSSSRPERRQQGRLGRGKKPQANQLAQGR